MSAALDTSMVAELVRQVASLDSTVLLFCRVPSFEVEFAALEMEEELELSSWDEAVLALAAARGAVTPRDADAYLGLGGELSQSIVENLVRERLLAERAAPPSTWGDWQDSPYVALFSGLGRLAGLGGLAGKDPRPASAARPMKDSGAPDSPLYELTDAGTSVLRDRKRVVRYQASARLVLWEEPLRFLRLDSERRREYAQLHRDPPLKPEDVPPVFRTIDDVLGLPPAERAQRIGIETSIPGLKGRLVGVSPGSAPKLVGVEPGKSWEVRRLRENRDGLLIIAGFATSMPERLLLRTLIGSSREVRDDVHLPASTLFDSSALAPDALIDALRARGHSAIDMKSQGAFEVHATADVIESMLGRGETPSDTFVELEEHIPGWSAAVRVRALPADRAAAERAFFLFLSRRRPALRTNLERACMETAAKLRAYWKQPFEPPPVEAVLAELWKSRELRQVVCERRLEADLVTPYVVKQEEHRNG